MLSHVIEHTLSASDATVFPVVHIVSGDRMATQAHGRAVDSLLSSFKWDGFVSRGNARFAHTILALGPIGVVVRVGVPSGAMVGGSVEHTAILAAPVVFLGSDGLKVGRIEATRVTAQVVDMQSVGYGADEQFVGETVNGDLSPFVAGIPTTVPITGAAGPEPTPVRVGVGLKGTNAVREWHAL